MKQSVILLTLILFILAMFGLGNAWAQEVVVGLGDDSVFDTGVASCNSIGNASLLVANLTEDETLEARVLVRYCNTNNWVPLFSGSYAPGTFVTVPLSFSLSSAHEYLVAGNRFDDPQPIRRLALFHTPQQDECSHCN